MATRVPFKNINMMTKEQYAGLPALYKGDLYAISGSGISLPSSRYIDWTLGASSATYTAPADGWVYINKVAGTANAYVSLQNGSAGALGITLHVPGAGNTCRGFLPVKKGDLVGVSYNATGATNVFRFIYAEGE